MACVLLYASLCLFRDRGSLAELKHLTKGEFDGGILYLVRTQPIRGQSAYMPEGNSNQSHRMRCAQGDHVFSDLSRPNRHGWRTGAIIHELEREARHARHAEYPPRSMVSSCGTNNPNEAEHTHTRAARSPSHTAAPSSVHRGCPPL